ncbi:MAG: hypothetical protein JOZ72_13800 [Alphaproteobacteria bacterium]|nr:hypothetical protein [Alphaproteobacteria bacterium]
MSRPLVLRLAGAALFASVAAWALHQQAGYIMAAWSCAHASEGIWLSGALALLLLLAGAAISWIAFKRSRADGLEARHFLAGVALMAAAIFCFALLLQIAAPFFLPGCVA